jgi:hypothetical protein
MAAARGKRKVGDDDRPPLEGEGPSLLPDFLRRALGVGFSGLFMTEEAIRKALGDTVPKDWVDFAVEQRDRTRSEFIERLSAEIARRVDTDVETLLRRLLQGYTVELNARIRFTANEAEDAEDEAESVSLRITRDGSSS